MSRRVAVVTMVYNEPVFLPLWLRYYGRQFGSDACYVVDHGSDDGSTEGLHPANVVRIPRSPMHDKKRAGFISQFCSSLLTWYDAVIYTDVDEFLVPDPEEYSSLSDLTERTEAQTITAIGLNVIYVPAIESEFDPTLPILGQRRWTRFVFAMCKPLVTFAEIKWTPGFHSSDRPLTFDHLFLFHLHYFDIKSSLRRLAKTRAMPWGDGPPDHYQRWPDEKHEEMVKAIAGLPRVENATFRMDDPIIGRNLRWMSDFIADNPDKRHLFYFNNGIPCNELLRIPDRFMGAF